MSARKYPAWLPPAAFVGALAVALLLSNQAPVTQTGEVAIASESEYQTAKTKVERLSLPVIRKYDEGAALTPSDLKDLRESGSLVDRMNLFKPTISGNLFLSGKIHLALGEPNVAADRFEQCTLVAIGDIAQQPAEAEPIKLTAAEANYQLSLLRLARRDFAGAYSAADDAIATVPNSSFYYTARASALNELRRTAEAKRDLQKALQLDPNNARAKSLLRFISE